MGFLGTFFTVIAVVVVGVSAIIYFIGLPSEWTEAIQNKIIQEAGEDQASQFVKDQVGKIPKADRKKAEQLQKGIEKVTGGDLQNPLGNLTSAGKKLG